MATPLPGCALAMNPVRWLLMLCCWCLLSGAASAQAPSISLEPGFWTALEAAAARRSLPLSALVAAIDAVRIEGDDPPNLASAIRSWLLGEVGAR